MSLTPESLSIHPIRTAEIGKLTYYYLEAGQGDALFFLHGFPDLANTWDESITALSGQYRCIAPFLRGYYPSSISEDGDYRAKTIAEDIAALAEELKIERFALVGHDWGASVAYALANLKPEAVSKLITIAIPHPRFLTPSLKLLYKARHFIRFRGPASSLAYTRRRNFAYIDTLYRRWAPNWDQYQKTSELIKQTFAQPGRLEAALGYYWSFRQHLRDEELLRFYAEYPQMPLLAFAGKSDKALDLGAYDKMLMKKDRFAAGLKVAIHDTAGHFLHREAPEFFLDQLGDFLEN